MRANKGEQQALITLLNRIYGEIRMLEEAHGLVVGAPDYRPRIEYYHDAIRALTSGSADVYGKGGRLSVEYLAYDVSSLRHIQSAPLGQLKPTMPSLSTQIMVPSGQGARVTAKAGIDRATRQQLVDLYKNYTVIFVALLADPADKNFQSRVDGLNAEVEELAMMEQLLQAMQAGKGNEAAIENLLHQMESEEIQQIVAQLLNQKGQKKNEAARAALAKLKEIMNGNDREIATVEAAHFTYATSQLAVYEESKDVVKKMAAQGMNIVGQFVDAAMAEARRNTSRGR